jgi:(R)-2-hydroxyacyl-CoA dehydratese activating ATPase
VKAAGLDIGSRTIECVVIDGATGAVLSSARTDTGPDLAARCAQMLSVAAHDRLMVTGYGRALAEVTFAAPSITEILAFARGAGALYPGCRTVLDLGGQDTKVIALRDGRPTSFEMNDRCAAGAGRLLEIMAAALHYGLDEFGPAALAGRDGVVLNSMCAVFAESEVVGLLTRGVRREDIARAVHQAILRRAVVMLQRVGAATPIVFAGGGARNACLTALLSEMLGQSVLVPADPQAVGALGAALLAAERE